MKRQQGNTQPPSMLYLYRGDSIPLALGLSPMELFLGNGIVAKSIEGYDSKLFKGVSIQDLIINHIYAGSNEEDQQRQRRSPLISFSSNESVARRYMLGRSGASIPLADCQLHCATHFIITLSIDRSCLVALSSGLNGCYIFQYQFERTALRRHMVSEIESLRRQGRELDEAETEAYCFDVRLFDNEQFGTHQAVIVDVHSFVKAHPSDLKSHRNAARLAETDKEWLLLPCDAVDDSRQGLPSAIFKPNKLVDVQGYAQELSPR